MMMWKEFEELAGYEVSHDDYNKIIEPMYMATNLSKQEFIKCLDRKRFALPTKQQLVEEMKRIAKYLADTCESYTDYEARERLDKIAKVFALRFYGLDWSRDSKVYVIFLTEYAFPTIQRGCTFPKTLLIGRDNHEYERIELVKVA